MVLCRINKSVLYVECEEANHSCGKFKLFGGLDVGIESGICPICIVWRQHPSDEKWGFLLVDAWNSFNEFNRIPMMWMV